MSVANTKNLPTARRILALGLKRYKGNIRPLIILSLIWLVVSTSLSFLGEISLLASQIWGVLMFTILVWLFSRSTQDQPKISQLFYLGSSNFVKQALVLMIFIIYLLPFTIGAGLAQFINLYQFSPSPTELGVARAFWFLLTLVSGYWLLRAWLAPLYITQETPIKAIKKSWDYTKGRLSWMLRCVGLMSLIALLPLIAVQTLFFLPITSQWFFLAVNISSSFIAYVYSLPLLISTSYRIKSYVS